jgi:hypothetical protein
MDRTVDPWNLEIWQAASGRAPYRWLLRDAQPPRYWYGAVGDDSGGWRFERVPDTLLPDASEDFTEPTDDSGCETVVQAFRDQVLQRG